MTNTTEETTDVELSPDMIWLTCKECQRKFTIADMDSDDCPHCGSEYYRHYAEGDR